MQAFLLYRAHHPLLHPLQQELAHLLQSNQHINCAGILFSTLSGMQLFAVNYTLEGESKFVSISNRSFQPLLLKLLLQ